jgi:hypothetical protein
MIRIIFLIALLFPSLALSDDSRTESDSVDKAREAA